MNKKKDISEDPAEKKNMQALSEKAVVNRENADFLHFLEKKNERIATALYVVTSFFPKEEPLRWEMRRISLVLLEVFQIQKDKNSINESLLLEETEVSLLRLVSFWNLSYSGGYISDANFDLLKAELSDILLLLKKRNKKEGTPLFPRSFFSLSDIISLSQDDDTEKKATLAEENISKKTRGEYLWNEDEKFFEASCDLSHKNKGQVRSEMKSERFSKTSISEEGRQGQTFVQKERPVPKVKKTRKISKTSVVGALQVKQGKNQVKGVARKEKILEVVRKNGDVGIKDISGVIVSCSEKTLQRELTTLVSEGVLKKEGERRWSRYSLR